jgi:hypothetical protein
VEGFEVRKKRRSRKVIFLSGLNRMGSAGKPGIDTKTEVYNCIFASPCMGPPITRE